MGVGLQIEKLQQIIAWYLVYTQSFNKTLTQSQAHRGGMSPRHTLPLSQSSLGLQREKLQQIIAWYLVYTQSINKTLTQSQARRAHIALFSRPSPTSSLFALEDPGNKAKIDASLLLPPLLPLHPLPLHLTTLVYVHLPPRLPTPCLPTF